MRFSSFNSAFSLCLFTLTSLLWSGLVNAQADPYNPSPFSSIGYLDAVHCDDPSDVLSGGWLKVNGHTVIIPKNLLVTLPSITVSWCELFKSGSSDTPDLPSWGSRPYEVSVTANRVSGQIIAGLVYIAPEFFGGADGFINFIDYATGELRIGGTIGDRNTGRRVLINDPVGRFAKAYTAWPLMAADTDNPSVKASTGFPVCIPRSDPATQDDPLCPKKNRPLTNGVPRSIFTFGAPPVAAGQPDPELMAPLMVGDFVTYSGAWVSADLVAAYELEANLGIYTAPGTKPAYVTIEDASFGIIGNPAGEIAETRVVGYTTDPSSAITVYAIDVDPCTGVETERTLAVVVPRPNGRLGQWRYRTDTDVGPATREVGAKIETGQLETRGGIVAGQFIQPIMDDAFTFPELNTFGAPMFQFDFQVIPFITEGSGPWLGGVPLADPIANPPIVGQLNPWPGSPKPNAPVCDPTPPAPPQIPKANAGPAQKVVAGVKVTLTGSSDTTTIPAGDLTFLWERIDTTGVAITLTGANTKTATFNAPTTFTGTTLVLKFRLTVSTSTATSTATVDITVTKAGPDTITLVSSTYSNRKGAGILVVRARTSVTDGTSILSLRTVNPNTPVTKMNVVPGAPAGTYELQVNVKPRPASVVITSNLGGTLTFVPQ